MKIHKDLEQGSEEWHNIRKLKGTASKATAIRTRGAGLKTLALELFFDYIFTGEKKRFVNEHTERGNELEAQARSIYEILTGNEVQQVGFIEHNDYIGCSPDGLIGEDGDLEIKCPSDKTYFEYIIDENFKVPSDYYNQCQMRLLIEKRKWCDIFFYNPNFTKSHILVRIEPDEKAFEELEEGFKMLEEEIKKLLEIYNKK
jgi:putative phage-type endonuclease